MSAEEENKDDQVSNKSIKKRRGVFASCCCGPGSDSGEDAKEHEIIIPQTRGCTDFPCLIIYVIFCCILLLIGVFALFYGNPLRLTNGMDSFGNICGTSNEAVDKMPFSGLDMTEKPYVFFFDLHNMDHTTKLCVSSCPNMTIMSMEELLNYSQNTSNLLCRYDFNNTSLNITNSEVTFLKESSQIFCPTFPIPSSYPVFKRCIPTLPTGEDPGGIDFVKIYSYLNNFSIFKQVLGDLAVTWMSVIVLTSLSFVISFLLVLLLYWMTAFISYLIIVIALLTSIGFTVYMWWTYMSLKHALDMKDSSMILEEMKRNECAFFWFSIISTVFTILFAPVLLYLRNRVQIIVRLFRETGCALLSIPCLTMFPTLSYITLTCFFSCWLYIVLCLATADQLHPRQISLFQESELPKHTVTETGHIIDDMTFSNESSTDYYDEIVPGPISKRSADNQTATFQPKLQNRTVSLTGLSNITILEYSKGIWIKYLWWIYLFGLFWGSEFILACQQMVVTSSIAAWYFSRNREKLKWVVMESTCRLIKYHLGSMALGSLLISIVKLPRLLLKFLDRVCRKYADLSIIIKWTSWSCTCCLKTFDNFVKYVHHNAYTVIAIQGIGFCPASKLAFAALCQNVLQISAVNSMGDCVLFLTKFISASVTGLLAVVYFQQNQTLHFYASPVLMTTLFAYFVAHCVVSVFETAADTLFLCFLEDHNMHMNEEQQFYASPSLLKFMTVDAVDAVASNRTSFVPKDGHEEGNKSSQQQQNEVNKRYWDQRNVEEAIPMNPYAPTTTTIT